MEESQELINKSEKIKLDFKDVKYATGRRKTSIAKVWLKKGTGKKFENKKYYRHTGYPGGIKETTPEKLFNKKPGEVLKLAVKRMLPGGPLAKKQLTKLKMYSGDKHPHEAQNLTVIELSKLNSKNLVRN